MEGQGLTLTSSARRSTFLTSLRDRAGSLLSTSVDEKDEDVLSFEIDLRGDVHPDKPFEFYDEDEDGDEDNDCMHSELTLHCRDQNVNTMLSPTMNCANDHQRARSPSMGDFDFDSAGHLMAKRSISEPAKSACSLDVHRPRGRSNSVSREPPFINVGDYTTSSEVTDSNHHVTYHAHEDDHGSETHFRSYARSHSSSLLVGKTKYDTKIETRHQTQSRHFRLMSGSLKPNNLLNIFGKGFGSPPKRTPSVTSRHQGVQQHGGKEIDEHLEGKHILRRANNVCVRPPSIHLIEVTVSPQGDVNTILPATPDEEMEFREFYTSVLQTLLHPLGRIDKMQHNPLELVTHLQKVFHIPAAVHSTMVKEELNSRSETFFLRVTVVEAKNIKGMDANGLSDPYCILTVCNRTPGNGSTGGTGSPTLQKKGQQPVQSPPKPQIHHSRSGSGDSIFTSTDSLPSYQHANTLPAKSSLQNPRVYASSGGDYNNGGWGTAISGGGTSSAGSISSAGGGGGRNGSYSSSNNNNKYLSPQGSLPEINVGHNSNLQRNIWKSSSFSRKARRRKSLEHLGVGSSRQTIQQDLLLSVPSNAPLKGSKSFESSTSPYLSSSTSIEADSFHKTTCKLATLHPVWNETFDMEMSNLDGELRITMWDWDEETSLWDACKSLESEHKIAGIKNIFRHIKHGVNKCTDDFLGQVIIPLNSLEAATVTEDWYRLQRGHSKVINSQVTGRLHLKMQFIRKEPDKQGEKDEQAMSFYHQLVTAVQKHDAGKHIRTKNTPWDGKLSPLSQHLLSHFAVQSGISKLSQHIIYLSALLDFQLDFDRKCKESELKPQVTVNPALVVTGLDETDSSPLNPTLTPPSDSPLSQSSKSPLSNTSQSSSSFIQMHPLPSDCISNGNNNDGSSQNGLNKGQKAGSESPQEKKDSLKADRILGTIIDPVTNERVTGLNVSSPKLVSALQRASGFDYGIAEVPENRIPPFINNAALGIQSVMVVNDRMVREALYKIHGEIMAESALTIYGDNPRGVATLFEKRPDWLRFETIIVEHSISSYIYECLASLPDCDPFFPPNNVPGLENANKKCKLQLIQNLQAMRVWRGRDTPVHQLVTKLLESVIRNDTRKYVLQELDLIPVQEGSLKPGELVDLLKAFSSVLGRMNNHCKAQNDYKNFFSRFQVDYSQTISIEIDRQASKFLHNVALMKLNQYQARYRRFPPNIVESSKAGLSLFMAVKQLAATLKKNIDRDDLEISNYMTWFITPLGYWLMTFQYETFNRVNKALELDKDVKLVHEVVKYSNSAIDVLACFVKVTQEWRSIGYTNPNTCCMAITKLTDLVCEGAKLYACKIHMILEANGFYKTSRDGQFDIKDKLCITLNNIEHVRGYLDNLPKLLAWEENCTVLARHHGAGQAGAMTLASLQRLTTRACEDIRYKSAHLERRIAYKMSREVNKLMDKFVNPNKKVSVGECMESLLDYIDDNLGTLYKQLLPQIFPRLVQALWNSLLASISSRIQDGRPPGYYKRLQQSLDSLEAYFQRPGIELTTAKTRTAEYGAIVEKLLPNVSSTHGLMMDYYRALAVGMATPAEYLGHVSIKMAYLQVPEGLRSLTVKVCNAVDLPGVNSSGLSDPQVIVDVCPEMTFNKSLSLRTKARFKELNPIYNEVFQFGALPDEAFETDSVQLSVTVINNNAVVCHTFLGEAFIPLCQARQITEKQTVDHCPAVMLALRRPGRLRGNIEILRSRSKWDRNAKKFIAKRTWAIEQQRPRTDKRIVTRLASSSFFPQ